MVTQLPQEFFEFLTDFQRRLCQVIRSVGKIEHDQWRSFCNERKTEAMEVSAFISGKYRGLKAQTGLFETCSNLQA